MKDRFDIYDKDEYSTLGLMRNYTKDIKEVEEKVDNKTDKNGNHLGAWQGINRPTRSDEGLAGTIEKIVDEDLPNINNEILNITSHNIKTFGAIGDGVTDDTQAFLLAIQKGGVIDLESNKNYLIKNTLTLMNDVYFKGSNNKLLFAVPGGASAIRTTQTDTTTLNCGLENLTVECKSWSEHLGYGLDIEQKITLKNVTVSKFQKDNIFLHHGLNSNGPYNSLFENVRSTFSGGNGLVIGTGANCLTLINYVGFWNGAPAHGTPPTGNGNGDGLIITHEGFGNPGSVYPSYKPEGIVIIGGDCSYNSGYGWNFESVRDSNALNPGYSEDNFKVVDTLNYNVNIGNNVEQCNINLGVVKGGQEKVRLKAEFYKATKPSNVYLGGKYLGSGATSENYGIKNLRTILSMQDDNTANTVAITTNNTNGVAKIVPYGTSTIEVGGNRNIKAYNDRVELPIRHKFYDDDGKINDVSIGTSSPSSGTYLQGDIRINKTPTPGGYLGWVCTTGGTPGTWKGFGLIEN